MEVYTFIHKETKEIIRAHFFEGADEEFSRKYYFTDGEYATLWFVKTREEIDFIIKYKKFVHPQYTMFPNMPSTEFINLDDYEVAKFNLNDDKNI